MPTRSRFGASRGRAGSASTRASARCRPRPRSATASARRRTGGAGSASRARRVRGNPSTSSALSSAAAYPSSLSLIRSTSSRPSSSSYAGRARRATGTEYARPTSSPSTTSSSVTPAAAASSAIVGDRPSSAVMVSSSRSSERFSSFSGRGTRTDQARSRKWRFSSPTIVGTANVVSSTSRSTSKRSIALIKPIEPTWTRSSSDSPRRAYRRASARTSGMKSAMSRSRASRSSVPVIREQQRASVGLRGESHRGHATRTAMPCAERAWARAADDVDRVHEPAQHLSELHPLLRGGPEPPFDRLGVDALHRDDEAVVVGCERDRRGVFRSRASIRGSARPRAGGRRSPRSRGRGRSRRCRSRSGRRRRSRRPAGVERSAVRSWRSSGSVQRVPPAADRVSLPHDPRVQTRTAGAASAADAFALRFDGIAGVAGRLEARRGRRRSGGRARPRRRAHRRRPPPGGYGVLSRRGVRRPRLRGSAPSARAVPRLRRGRPRRRCRDGAPSSASARLPPPRRRARAGAPDLRRAGIDERLRPRRRREAAALAPKIHGSSRRPSCQTGTAVSATSTPV